MIWIGPNSKGKCHYMGKTEESEPDKRGKERRGEGSVATETETGVTWPYSKEAKEGNGS